MGIYRSVFDLFSDVLYSEECHTKSFSLTQNVCFFQSNFKFCITKRLLTRLLLDVVFFCEMPTSDNIDYSFVVF